MLDLLKMELQAIVRHLTRVMETKLSSSAGAECVESAYTQASPVQPCTVEIFTDTLCGVPTI